MGHSLEYIAAGGNRHPSAADCSATTGLVAFGADRNIALWNLEVCLEPEDARRQAGKLIS